MDETPERPLASVAAAIGLPARARMLLCLLDGRARTSTELSAVGGVTPSTASIHLKRMRTLGLVQVSPQGRHRYYALSGPTVASALEAMNVLADGSMEPPQPTTPAPLRLARTCYDHLAGSLGVALLERFQDLEWLAAVPGDSGDYRLTRAGAQGFSDLGVDVAEAQAMRRRFAFACLDWSERRPHLGGALGKALFDLALEHGWIEREVEGRVLHLTSTGRRHLRRRLGLSFPPT